MERIVRKLLLSSFSVGLVLVTQQIFAADLAQVYQDSLDHDQTYANALATEKDAAEASPQALALLLPQIGIKAIGGIAKTTTTGGGADQSPLTSKSFAYGLALTQQVFNYSDWMGLASAKNSVKAAYATFSFAQQDLIQRVTTNYLSVLHSQDLLTYAIQKKNDLYQQYQQAEESFKVGTKTKTDVYQARSAYEGAVSAYIQAKNNLAIAYEVLSVNTNKHYDQLKPLGKKIPLIVPKPDNIHSWMHAASTNNWQVVSARYEMFASKDNLSEQRAAYLPSISAGVDYNNTVTANSQNGVGGNNSSTRVVAQPNVAVTLTMPIFNNGAGASSDISSSVRQYMAKYEEAQTTFELTNRQQVANARTYYLDVVSDISKVEADRKTIIYDRSALEGTQAGYQVGTQTMLDVLNQENTLYNDLSTYAADRYQYINDAISLKETAGTLSEKDLDSINTWLMYPEAEK